MALNNFDEDQFDQESIGGDEFAPEPQKPRGNRTFLIALAIIGVIFVLLLVLFLIFGPAYVAKQQAASQENAARINAANTATALAVNAMAAQQATLLAPTKTPAPISAAGGTVPTKTPVVAIRTNTPAGVGGSGLSAAELATVSALKTQVAAGTVSAAAAAATSTALPSTGFADEVGLPMMAGVAIVLVAVIILSRRLRLNAR